APAQPGPERCTQDPRRRLPPRPRRAPPPRAGRAPRIALTKERPAFAAQGPERNTLTLLFALFTTTRSGTPSRLRSPVARATGFFPTGRILWGGTVRLPRPRSTPRLLFPRLATTTSRLPSESRSSRRRLRGSCPTVRSSGAEKEPLPSPKS